MNYLDFEDLTICPICNSKLIDETDQLICDEGHWALNIGDHYYSIDINEKTLVFKNNLGVFSIEKNKTTIHISVSLFNKNWECINYVEFNVDIDQANNIIHACVMNDVKYLTKLIVLL